MGNNADLSTANGEGAWNIPAPNPVAEPPMGSSRECPAPAPLEGGTQISG
jgi:hypothetical protein